MLTLNETFSKMPNWTLHYHGWTEVFLYLTIQFDGHLRNIDIDTHEIHTNIIGVFVTFSGVAGGRAGGAHCPTARVSVPKN